MEKIKWWNWEKKDIYKAIRLLESDEVEKLQEFYYSEVVNRKEG